VTNRTEHVEDLYKGFYVQRGAVPEQPIGELKNGLRADRLSACGFCVNAWRLLVHGVAYAIVVLFRQANAHVPEVARAAVGGGGHAAAATVEGAGGGGLGRAAAGAAAERGLAVPRGV
jgi:hypothetical protein